MTDKTATQNLTRTTVNDDPKRMAEYLGTFAGEVDSRVTSHLYDLGRSQVPPFAVIRKLEVVSYDTALLANDFVPFDTVMVDTAGLVDFSESSKRIALDQTGYWAVGGYIQCTGFGNANNDTFVQVTAAGLTFYNGVRDQAIGLAATSVSGLVQVTTPYTQDANLNFGFQGSSASFVTTLQFAELWAYKVRDL